MPATLPCGRCAPPASFARPYPFPRPIDGLIPSPDPPTPTKKSLPQREALGASAPARCKRTTRCHSLVVRRSATARTRAGGARLPTRRGAGDPRRWPPQRLAPLASPDASSSAVHSAFTSVLPSPDVSMLPATELHPRFKNSRGEEREHPLVHATLNASDQLVCPRIVRPTFSVFASLDGFDLI